MAEILTRESLLRYIQDNSADLAALVLQTEVGSVETFQYALITAAEELDGTVITREQLDSWLTTDDIKNYLPEVAKRFDEQRSSIEGPRATEQLFADFQRNATDPFAAVKSYARSFSAPTSASSHDLSNRANNVAASYQEFADFQGSRLNANVEGRLRALNQVTQYYQPMSGFTARPTQYDWYTMLRGEGRDALSFVGTVFQTQQTDVVSALLSRSGPTQMITQGYREGGGATSAEILMGNEVSAAAARQRDSLNPRIRTLQMDSPTGSLHAKMGALYDERGVTQLAFIGGQNITPALERTTTIEDMVVFDRARARDQGQFDVVSREIRAASEVMLDIQSSQGTTASVGTIRTQFRQALDTRLGGHRQALFVNQEIHNRINQTIQETADSPGRKLVLSMQYIESALNPNIGNSVLNQSLRYLGTLAERGALSIAVSSTSYSEKLGLFKLLDDMRGINPADLRNGTIQKAKYNLLQTLISNDSFTLLPSQYVHSKSLAVLDAQNRLVQFATGSANLSSNSRYNNLETMVFLQGDLLNALDERDITEIEQYYYYGLSTFSRPNRYQGMHVERMGNEAMALRGLQYLQSLGGIETRSSDATSAPFTFSRRYLIGKGQQRLVGATIEIRSPVRGQRNYSFDVTFGAEHIAGRPNDLSPVIYLNKTQRTIVGAVYKNGTEQDFTFKAYKEQTGEVETRTLGRSDTYLANAFDVLGGLITTTHYAMGYEARTRGLISAYKTINQASLQDSISQMLSMQLLIGVQRGREAVGLGKGELPNINFGNLTEVLDYVRGLSHGQRRNSLQIATMTLATPIEHGQYIPNYERYNDKQRADLLGARADQMRAMMDYTEQAFAAGESSGAIADTLIKSMIGAINTSTKQGFDPAKQDRYTGLYNDIMMSLIKSNDLAQMTYARDVKTGISEAFSLQTDAFAQPHTMNYSQGQQLHDYAVFGMTQRVSNIYNTMFGGTPLGLVMNPYPLQHGEALGGIGEYQRAVGAAQGRSVPVPFTEMYGGLNKVEGGAPRVHVMAGLAQSMPTLDALTRRKYKETLNQVLGGRWADLDIDSVIDKLAATTYDWYDHEQDKSEEDQMLYYFPYAKTEQISQRMKNLTSGRVMFDASKELIRFALSLGTDRVLDLSDSTKSISGNVLTALSSQQFRALKDEFVRRGGDSLDTSEKKQSLLKTIAMEWSMDDRRAGKGFMGSERPRLLAITNGGTQLADYGLFNPEYRKTEDDYKYGMKFVKPHVIQATGTLSDTMQSGGRIQQLVREQLVPGTIFLARDIKVQHSDVLTSFRQQLESRVNTLLGLSGGITGNLLADDTTTIINNLSARTTTAESGEIVTIGRDLAREALRTAVEQINDENKTTSLKRINNKLELYYQKGVYSPTGIGDNPYEQLNNLRRIGTIYDGDSEFTLFDFSTYEGKGTDLRRGPVKIRIPAHSARHLNAFTVLLDADVNVSKSNTYTLDLQTVTLEDFGAGMRHGTVFPKGPFKDAPLELWDVLSDWANYGKSQELLPRRLVTSKDASGQLAIKPQDIYAMIGPSQIKGFNFEMGLMLLEEQRQSGIYQRIQKAQGGQTVAEALGFFFLSRGKVIGEDNLRVLKSALGQHLIDTGRAQFGQSLIHQTGGRVPNKLGRFKAADYTSSLEYFGGLAALAMPKGAEGLESALLRATVQALKGNTTLQGRLQSGALHLLDNTFGMEHSLNIAEGIYSHEDTFATRPTGLLAFLVKASQDIFADIDVKARMRSANMAEIALGRTSAFSTEGLVARGGLLGELGNLIKQTSNDFIGELRATMRRRIVVDKLGQLSSLTGGDLTTFLNRVSADASSLSPQDIKTQRLIGELQRLINPASSSPQVISNLLGLYNETNFDNLGAARVRSIEAYGNMAADVYEGFGQATEEIASRFGFKLADRTRVQSILDKVMRGDTVSVAEQKVLEGVEYAFEFIRTYIQTQRYILMPAEMMFSKIATPAGNKNVTALEGHIARSLTAKQLKMYTYSPNDYTDIGSITEALITLGMIHEGTMPGAEQMKTQYRLAMHTVGTQGLSESLIPLERAGNMNEYYNAQKFAYRFLSNYTIFSRHALPGMRGVSEVGLGARATYDYVAGNRRSAALDSMTTLAGITRLPMGANLSYEEDISSRVGHILNLTERTLRSRFDGLQGALYAEYSDLGRDRGLDPEEFITQVRARGSYQALSAEERTLTEVYYAARYANLNHSSAYSQAITAAASLHRNAIQDQVMQAYNTNNGAEYLEGMKALYKSLDAITESGRTITSAESRRAGILKKMLRTSHFIALPELTAVSDRDGRIQLRGDHTKSTTGVILGLDVLEKMSLLFASESHEALSTQHQLVVKLQQMDKLLNRIQRETFGNRTTWVTSEEQEQISELQSLMLTSKSSAVMLVNNVNSIRQATANRLSMMGASFIAMNSFLVNSTEVALGRRFDDANAVSRLGGISRILQEFRPSFKMLGALEDDAMRRGFFLTAYAEESQMYGEGARGAALTPWKQIRASGYDPMSPEGAAMKPSVIATLSARRATLQGQVDVLDAIPQPTGAVDLMRLDAYREGQKNKQALLGRIAALDNALYYAEHGNVRGMGSARPIFLFTWGITGDELEARRQETAEIRARHDSLQNELYLLDMGVPLADAEGKVISSWYRIQQTARANLNSSLEKATSMRNEMSLAEMGIPYTDAEGNLLSGWYRTQERAQRNYQQSLYKAKVLEQRYRDRFRIRKAMQRQNDLVHYQKVEKEVNQRYDATLRVYDALHYSNSYLDTDKAVKFRSGFREYLELLSHVIDRNLEGFTKPDLGGPLPKRKDYNYQAIPKDVKAFYNPAALADPNSSNFLLAWNSFASYVGAQDYMRLVEEIDVKHRMALPVLNQYVKRYNEIMRVETGEVKDHFRDLLLSRRDNELSNQYYNLITRNQERLDANLQERLGRVDEARQRARARRDYRFSLADFKREQRIEHLNIVSNEIEMRARRRYSDKLDFAQYVKEQRAERLGGMTERAGMQLARREQFDAQYEAAYNAQTAEQRAETSIIHRSLYQYLDDLQLEAWESRSATRLEEINRAIQIITQLKPHYTVTVNNFEAIHAELRRLLPNRSSLGDAVVDQAREILRSRAVPGGPELFELHMRSVSSPQEASDMIAGYRMLRENLTQQTINEPVYQDILRVHGIVGTESEGERSQLKRLFRQYEREYYRLANPVDPEQARASVNAWAIKLQAWARAYGNEQFGNVRPDLAADFVINAWRRQSYLNPQDLELQIITGKEVDYSNRDAVRNELEQTLFRRGVLVNRQGMPYSAANPPGGDAPGAAGHDAIDIIGTLSGRASAAHTLFKPTESSDTLMLISAFGFQFVGLGDYDGDSYQAALSGVTKAMGKVAQLRHELSKKEAAISRLQQGGGNAAEISILTDEREQLIRNLNNETEVMAMAIETNRAHAATQEKAVTGLRSYTSAFLALPEELVGDKLLPGTQVFSDRQLGGLVKQFRDTLGGFSDRASDIKQVAEAMPYLADFTSSDTLFSETSAAQLRDLKGSRDAARIQAATKGWFELLELTNQMDTIRNLGTLDEQKLAFSQAIALSESAQMAASSASKFLGNITGSQINPADLGTIQSVMGTTGGGLLGKVYNTVVPVVGTMTGDLAMHKVMRSEQIVGALKTNFASMDFSGVSDPAVLAALSEVKGELSALEVDGETWQERLRVLEAKNAVGYRFMLTTQQFLRDAALKPKQAGGLVNASRSFQLSADAIAKIEDLDIKYFGANEIDLADITGYSSLLKLEPHVERSKSERFLEIVSQDFIGSVATTNLKYRYGLTEGNEAAQYFSTDEQRPMTAFAVLQMLTDYAGPSSKTAAELMSSSLYGNTLSSIKKRVESTLEEDRGNPIINRLRELATVDGVVNDDLLVRNVITDLMSKFQADFIADAVMENYKSIQPEVTQQGYNAYGLEVSSDGYLSSPLVYETQPDDSIRIASTNQYLENTAKAQYLEHLKERMLHKNPSVGVIVPKHLERSEYNVGTPEWNDWVTGELERAGYTGAEILDIAGRLDAKHETFMSELQNRQRLVTERFNYEVARSTDADGNPVPISDSAMASALIAGIQEDILQKQMPELVDTLGRVKQFNTSLTEVRQTGTTEQFRAVVNAMEVGANAISVGVLNETALSGAFGATAYATDAGKLVGGDLTKAYAQNYQFLLQSIQDYTKSLPNVGDFSPELARSIYSYLSLGPGMPTVIQETLDAHTQGLSDSQRESARQSLFVGMLQSQAFETIAGANAYTAQISQVRELNTLANQRMAEVAATPVGAELPISDADYTYATELAARTEPALGVSFEEFGRRGGTVYEPVDNPTDSPLVNGYERFERVHQELERVDRLSRTASQAALNVEQRRVANTRLRSVHRIGEGMSLFAVPMIFAAMQGDIPITEQIGEAAFNIAQGAVTMTTFENSALGNMYNPERQEALQQRMLQGHTRMQYGRLQEYLQNIESPTEAIFRGVLGEAIFSGAGVAGGYLGQAVDRFRGVGNAGELLGGDINIPGESGAARLITEVAAGSLAMALGGIVSKRPILGTLITEDDFAGRMWKQVTESAAAIANYVSQNIMGADDYDEADFELMDGDTGESIQMSLRQTDATERSSTALLTHEFYRVISSDTDSRSGIDEYGLSGSALG